MTEMRELTRYECPECGWSDHGALGEWHAKGCSKPAYRCVRYVALATARPHLRAAVAAEIVQRLRQRAALWHGSEVEAAVIDEAADFIEREFVSVRPDNEETKS